MFIFLTMAQSQRERIIFKRVYRKYSCEEQGWTRRNHMQCVICYMFNGKQPNKFRLIVWQELYLMKIKSWGVWCKFQTNLEDTYVKQKSIQNHDQHAWPLIHCINQNWGSPLDLASKIRTSKFQESWPNALEENGVQTASNQNVKAGVWRVLYSQADKEVIQASTCIWSQNRSWRLLTQMYAGHLK